MSDHSDTLTSFRQYNLKLLNKNKAVIRENKMSDPSENAYVNQYTSHKQHYSNQKLRSIEIFSKDVNLIEDVLGFQKWLDDKIATILNDNAKALKIQTTENELDHNGITHFIYRKNWILLCSLYETGLSDEFNLPNIIMRTIHEGVLNLIFLSTHEDNASSVKMYMEKQYNKAFNKFDEKHKGIQEYTPKYIRDTLFAEEMKESMNKVYGGLSIATHPNIYENTRQLETYGERRVHEALWFVLRESFYNLVFFVENFRNKSLIINEIKKDGKIAAYIDSLKKRIVEDEKIVDLFPNKNNLGHDFILYNPNDMSKQ